MQTSADPYKSQARETSKVVVFVLVAIACLLAVADAQYYGKFLYPSAGYAPGSYGAFGIPYSTGYGYYGKRDTGFGTA
uniref:Secreted protein n=1 Tax=Panagrellus redivivus TaxID=6233 RepID=A0A7E4UR43_PANRE